MGKRLMFGIAAMLICLFSFSPYMYAEETVGRISELFPDKVLAEQMRCLVSPYGNDEVSQSQLDSITFLQINFYEDWLGVQDWTGIRLLTNLTELHVQGWNEALFDLKEIENLQKLES